MRNRGTLVILAAAFGALAAPGVFAQDFAVQWGTADGGGAMRTGGGGYELSGTIGQPDASPPPAAGGGYAVTGGFWPVSLEICLAYALVDFDRDCDVDADDFETFESCVSGPAVPHPDTPTCDKADVDRDDDVDQDDFGTFQRCYSGANHAADPACTH